MVAATPRHVGGRLRQRSGPEPIGCTAESNQPHALPPRTDDSGSPIAGPDRKRSLFPKPDAGHFESVAPVTARPSTTACDRSVSSRCLDGAVIDPMMAPLA